MEKKVKKKTRFPAVEKKSRWHQISVQINPEKPENDGKRGGRYVNKERRGKEEEGGGFDGGWMGKGKSEGARGLLREEIRNEVWEE